MDKLTKRIILISTSVVTLVLALLVYFATQFSSTYPHLKDYSCATTAKQLEKEIIQIVASDAKSTYTITDSTGTKNNRNYYMTIEQNLDNVVYSYHITYADKKGSNCNLV